MTDESPVNPTVQQARDFLDRDAEAARRDARDVLGPCQHYWLQYMEVDSYRVNPYVHGTLYLKPSGYYCVHCPARSDEDRVITNPEAL